MRHSAEAPRPPRRVSSCRTPPGWGISPTFPTPYEKERTRALRGWERSTERLPPGYRLDTTDAAVWVLRRPDGTAVSNHNVWTVTRKAVEAAAQDDHRARSKRGTLAFRYPSK
jgi:hypothetical protein